MLHARVKNRSASGTAERLLGGVIVLLAVFLFLLFAYAAARRIRYPYELEWIESGMLTSVLRIVRGEGLYVAPSLHFVPFLYAPFYFYLVAGVTRFTGLGSNDYVALRAVSILSSLGSVGLIFALIRTETRNFTAACAGAGMYLGCYALLGCFFDIGRVDALFIFFILLALYAQRRGYPVVAALIWVLAFQTKQSVLPLAVLVLLSEWQTPRRALLAIVSFLTVAIVSVLWINHATSGWYVFYTFRVTRALHVLWRQAALYWPSTVLHPLQIAWVVIAAAALCTRISWRSRTASFYGFVSIALFGGVWFVESHVGASSNTAMPIVAWTAVLFGVASGHLLNTFSNAELEAKPTSSQCNLLSRRARFLVLLAMAAQLFALIYNPGQFLPASYAYASSEGFMRELRAMPGDVYILNHNHDAALAGRPTHAEGEALGAVIDAHLGEVSSNLRREFYQNLADHRYSAVVVDDKDPARTSWRVESFYPRAIGTPAAGENYLTSQPEWFLLPCSAPPGIAKALATSEIRSDGACPARAGAE